MAFAKPVLAMDENAANANKAHNVAGKNVQAAPNNRKALGDIGNLVGPFNSRCIVDPKKEAAAKKAAAPAQANQRITRAAAAAAAGLTDKDKASGGTWGTTKPRSGLPLRARDPNLPESVESDGKKGRSMSSLLQLRSEAAVTRSRHSEPRSPLPDIDSVDKENPLAATEYVGDIFVYYKRIEPLVRVAPDYMTKQSDINDKMRAILVDWLVEVHLKFKLMPETLFLTCNLIDRYLELQPVTRKNLQLVGVTAMLIASKYEEIWAPEVRDFVYISDRAYTREQILGMEKLMLNTLKFNLTVPTPYNFLSRYLKATGAAEETDKPADEELTMYATYLVELSLPEYSMLKYSYSCIAGAAVYLANRALCRDPVYPRALQRHSGYKEESLLPCTLLLAALHKKASAASLVAVYKKYSGTKFLEVAKLPSPTGLSGDFEG